MQGLRCWPVQGPLSALETVIKSTKRTEGAKKELEIVHGEQKRPEIVEDARGRAREGETDSGVVLGAIGAPPDSARGLLIETRSSRDTRKQLKLEDIRQGKSKMKQFYYILFFLSCRLL